MQQPQWYWNEMQQVGTDYASVVEVEAYDQRMATIRDVDSENRAILDRLGLQPGASILEIGCGTGRFVRMAVSQGYAVAAADVSRAMLDYVAAKVEEEGLPSIALQQAGFLTMEAAPETYDAVVSVAALHHLPDAWKYVALCRVHTCLKPGGQFILRDVVFSSSQGDPCAGFERFVDGYEEPIRTGAIGHVAREYSTYDWIMEGLLKWAGFDIDSAVEEGTSFWVYHCRKGEGV